MEELVDIFTKDGYKIGISMPRETAIREGKLIKAFQIWILNNKNQVLMEQRSNGKLHDAGMLDLCSGHVQKGELERQAVRREIKEELGENVIRTKEFENIIKVGSELCDFRKYGRPGNYIIPWYILKLDREIPETSFNLQEDEVAGIQWMDYVEVKEMIKSGSNNIRIPYLPQTKNLLQKLDEIIYERGQER